VIGAQFLRNLIERRNLLFQLAKRDFRQRYIGSAAGWLWGLGIRW
jgi:ABC-type polysaccharide/polyol phosphate export permease